MNSSKVRMLTDLKIYAIITKIYKSKAVKRRVHYNGCHREPQFAEKRRKRYGGKKASEPRTERDILLRLRWERPLQRQSIDRRQISRGSVLEEVPFAKKE